MVALVALFLIFRSGGREIVPPAQPVSRAAGQEAPRTRRPDDIQAQRVRAGALAEARRMLATDADGRADDAVASVSKVIGEATKDKQAVAVLTEGLTLMAFTRARNDGLEEALKEIDGYRARFTHVDRWKEIEREARLGSLWTYTDPRKRRIWVYMEDRGLIDRLSGLREKGETDAAFQWRLGETMHRITVKVGRVPGFGIPEMAAAVERDQQIAKKHDGDLRQVLEECIGLDRWPVETVRRLVRDRYYGEMKTRLVQGLTSEKKYERINCFAVLAEKDDVSALKDSEGFFKDIFGMFLEKQKLLSRRHWQALFGLLPDAAAKERTRTLIETTLAEVRNGEGPWSVYRDAPKILAAMRDDLAAVK